MRSRIVALAASRSAGSALSRRGIPSTAETEIGEAAKAASISAAGRVSAPACSSTASSPTDCSQDSFSASVSLGIIPSRIETFIIPPKPARLTPPKTAEPSSAPTVRILFPLRPYGLSPSS
jgi:hypothetical protein